MSEPVDTSAKAVERVSREDDARIESALRYDDSEYQLAFQEGYMRAMTVAERRWAKERAEQETLLAERNRDAERYRWLRERINWEDVTEHCGGVIESYRSWQHRDYRQSPPSSEHLDEYINAAMGAREGM
jgi:hypothetical protein